MEIRPINSDADFREALAEMERLWNAEPGTPEGDRLEVLATLVESYENRVFELPMVAPHAFLKAFMEHTGHTQADLAELLGSRARASELLSGKRPPTLEQIKRLHRAWDVPADAMIVEAEAA